MKSGLSVGWCTLRIFSQLPQGISQTRLMADTKEGAIVQQSHPPLSENLSSPPNQVPLTESGNAPASHLLSPATPVLLIDQVGIPLRYEAIIRLISNPTLMT